MQEEAEQPAPGGALRYDQYFPTMLPFQRPEAEAALRGEQPLEVATAAAAAVRVRPHLVTTLDAVLSLKPSGAAWLYC